MNIITKTLVAGLIATFFLPAVQAGGGGNSSPPPQWCFTNGTNQNIKFNARYHIMFIGWQTAHDSPWIGPGHRHCFSNKRNPMRTINLYASPSGSCQHRNVSAGNYRVTRVKNDHLCSQGVW